MSPRAVRSGERLEARESWRREVMTLTGHTEEVRSVAFSPDGKLIASGSRDSTIKVWTAVSGR